jgi:hypothetical protein
MLELDWADCWTESEQPTKDYPLCELLADVGEVLEDQDDRSILPVHS